MLSRLFPLSETCVNELIREVYIFSMCVVFVMYTIQVFSNPKSKIEHFKASLCIFTPAINTFAILVFFNELLKESKK